MYSASTVLGFVAALTLMISIDARLTLLSLISLPFVSLSVKYFGSGHPPEVRADSGAARRGERRCAGSALGRARRPRVPSGGGGDRAVQARHLEYLRRNRRLIALQGLFFPSHVVPSGARAMLVLWLGSREVIRGRITIGEFVAFNAYLAMLSWPMIAFGWVTNMLQRGMASWKRMLEVLDAVAGDRRRV